MSIKIFEDIEQRSEAWFQARCGIVTASEVGKLITPKTVKPAANDTSRGLIARLTAERITGHVEDRPGSFDMMRGTLDEPYARDAYNQTRDTPAVEVGFMVRDFGDYKLGYSPDGLVGDDGLIEIKSRTQQTQLATVLADEVPVANMAQIQAGLLVSGRAWCDYVSYCGGMPLYVKRVEPDTRWQEAIQEAVSMAEMVIREGITEYARKTKDMPVTVRVDHFLDSEIEV